MNTNRITSQPDSHETSEPVRRRFSLQDFLVNISTTAKMVLMSSVLFLGIVGITISAFVGLNSVRYQLSNIYDFMLVPIVAINKADAALADSQNDIAQSYNETLSASVRANYISHVESDSKTAHDVITRYDNEWVTTTSPEFTQALRKAGKLDLQKQELTALADFHTSFAAYQQVTAQYVTSIQTGKPDIALANQASIELDAARQHLQELININNQYADLSNSLAKAAYQQTLVTSGIVLLVMILAGAFMSYLVANVITSRLGELTTSALALQQGNLDQTVKIAGRDELTTLGTAFNNMAAQLKESFATLEARVSERTESLRLAAEVGRRVSQVSVLDVMLKDAAELIRTQFDLYYAQIYLTNPNLTELVLQAGTGNVGLELLSRGHRLPINTGSINGRAVLEKRAIIISNTAMSATFRPNPLLPDTRSEMAIPLLIGDKVVGVLDMQSQKPGSLKEDDLPAFEVLAGQLAVAIQNAKLLAETDQARAEVEKQARRLVRTNWQEYLDAIHKAEKVGFAFENNQVVPLELDATEQKANENAVSVPIAVTGEPLGSLVVQLETENQTPQNIELVNSVARQVAQQIESLRLLENAERYRIEAEEVARQATIEGWKRYIESRPENAMGYLYDTNEVRPVEKEPEAPSLTLPIKAAEETVGKLAILGLEEQDYEALELANAVAQRLGAHIENLRLLEETKRGQMELEKRARELAAVAEISSASAQELDIQRMLSSVVLLTQRKFELYHAHVFTYNENSRNLQIVACGWKEGDEHEGTHGTTTISVDQEQSLVARAARERRAVVVNDVRADPGWLPNPLLPDTRSEMAVPLLVGDQLLGVLDVQKDVINGFSEEDIAVKSTLATQVATALQNAYSFNQAQQQAERESMLNTISQKIQSATTVEAVLQIAARELGHALGAPLTIAQLGLKERGNGN